jgi:hypothetical protein
VTAALGGLALGIALVAGTAACVPTAPPHPIAHPAPVVKPKPVQHLENLTLVPCAVEDDTRDCYWDATKFGNGTGDSFIHWHGVYYYAEPIGAN